jgi:hypothetical protein
MWSKRFWLSLVERALKTFAQALIAIWPLGDAALGLVDVDWRKSMSIAGLAAAVSVLTSIVSAPVGPDGSPSLVGEPPQEPVAVLGVEAGVPMSKARHDLDGDPGELPAADFPQSRDIQQ